MKMSDSRVDFQWYVFSATSHLSGDRHKAHTTKEKWSMCLKIETNLFRMYEKIILIYGWKV